MEPAPLMKSLLSEKDIQLLKKTFLKVTELFYENSKNESACNDLLHMCNLIRDVIVTPGQASSISILSALETLRIKSKSIPSLVQPIDKTICHLKNPCAGVLQFEAAVYGLQKAELYVLTCTLLIRLRESLWREFDWKSIITQISRNCSVSPSLSVELMCLLCADNEAHCKLAVKSGLLKFVFASFIPSAINDKNNLYKALKLIRSVAAVDPTVLREKERILASVIFTHEDYTPIVQEICGRCYEEASMTQVQQKYDEQSIDQPYLWSHHALYCIQNIKESTVNGLVGLLRKTVSAAMESKILVILFNRTRANKTIIAGKIAVPQHASSLLNYLRWCMSSAQVDPNMVNTLDYDAIDKLAQISSLPKAHSIIKCLKQMRDRGSKVGHLSQSLRKMYTNQDSLLERASKVPQNPHDLEDIRLIFSQKESSDELQADSLTAAKDACFKSLKTAIIQRKPIDFPTLLNSYEFKSVTELSRLLQLLQLQLTMDLDLVDRVNASKVLEMIQWIEDHYSGEMIDWGSIGQLIILLKGEQEWVGHLKQIPSQCYWLLSITEASSEEEDGIFEMLDRVSKEKCPPQKLALILGFLGSVLPTQTKVDILVERKDLFDRVVADLTHNRNFKTNSLMLSMLFHKWYNQTADQPSLEDNGIYTAAIAPISNFILDNFRSTEQEYALLQSCIPYEFKVNKLQDQIGSLSSQFGKLARYIYECNSRRKGSCQLGRCVDGESMLECLSFLEGSSQLLQNDELSRLVDSSLHKKFIYWELYPNFPSIIKKIISIAATTRNSTVKSSQILQKVLENQLVNKDLSPEELADILNELKNGLKHMASRGVYLQIEKIRTIVHKIEISELRQEIIYILNGYKVAQLPSIPEEKQDESKGLNVTSSLANQNVSRPLHDNEPIQQQLSSMCKIQAVPDDAPNNQRNYSTKLPEIKVELEKNEIEKIDPSGKKQKLEQQKNEQIAKEIDLLCKMKMENGQELTLEGALCRLNQMVNKRESPAQFPRLVKIFMKFPLSELQKDVLGHLLSRFYFIDQQKAVLDLLLLKEKTNLMKENCYNLLKNYSQGFVLATRWKLLGRQWLDLAVLRLKGPYLADACQVIEYNLLKAADLEHYYEKRYNELVADIITLPSSPEEIISYLYLIGTSSKMPQVKVGYIAKKIQIKLLAFLDKCSDNLKVISNASYALSSLVYMQPEICLQIVKRKSQMSKLLKGYRKFYNSRAAVESGACLIANLAYSNEEVKELLREYGIIELLMFVFEQNISSGEPSTFKQLLRAFGNLSLSLKCSMEMIDQHFCGMAVKMAQKFDIFAHYDEKKARLMKILIDLIANLSAHRYKLEVIHRQKVTLMILTLLETTESNPHILMSCIDTIDGLCQSPQVENYAVTQKKLPYILIDILKIQEDEKIILKATRLLTNLTLNSACIQCILEANLLSVLANIVMPAVYGNKLEPEQNKKMETYVFKILTRISLAKQSISLILKSGYLDCLVRTIQSTNNLEDAYVEMLAYYAEHLPTFLNKRAFMCLIRVLTHKHHEDNIVSKSLNIFKTLLTYSYDRDEEDLVIEGVTTMYKQIIKEHRVDAILLLGYHCLRSFKLRALIRKDPIMLGLVIQSCQQESLEEMSRFVVFVIFNTEGHLLFTGPQTHEAMYELVRKGFNCKLYRANGTSKRATINLDQDYNFIARREKGGEIKKKYTANIRHIRDFQFQFANNSEQWQASSFTQEKGLFASSKANVECCCSIIASQKWGDIAFINVEFDKVEDKRAFYEAFCTLLVAFRG